MSFGLAAQLPGKELVFAILAVIWTGMTVLATRPHPKISPLVQRIALTITAAASGALLAWIFWSDPHPQPSDLAQVWGGARAVLNGENPYDAVGPGRAFDWSFPLLYPLTAVVALIPLAAFPLRWVDPLFVGLGFGLFTWAVTTERLVPHALVALVSLAAVMTLQTSQWSLLLTGAALVPGFGWLLIAKPTIGLALFAAFPSWKTAVGCSVFLIVTILIWPGWVANWLATFASAPHVVPPITRWAGPLVLLALLKWKRADARLLLGLACVPHTTVPYETIPLFLIPQSRWQAWGLWTFTLLAYLGQWATGPYQTQMDGTGRAGHSGSLRWSISRVWAWCCPDRMSGRVYFMKTRSASHLHSTAVFAWVLTRDQLGDPWLLVRSILIGPCLQGPFHLARIATSTIAISAPSSANSSAPLRESCAAMRSILYHFGIK